MLKKLWHILCNLNIFIFVNLAILLLQVLFCMVVLTPTISCFTGNCKTFWKYSPLSDTCIRHIYTQDNWFQAKTICQLHDAQLLSIRSEAMNAFILDFLNAGHAPVWVGLNDIEQDGHFKWLSSPKEPQYFNWYIGDPIGSKGADCVQINYKREGSTNLWRNRQCSETASSICEWKQACRKAEYGSECSEICPENCKQDGARFCNITTGNCHNCITGYSGAKCQSTCSENTYGENCNSSCSNNCKMVQNGSLCDRFSGTCLGGCTLGYQGPRCEEACVNNTFGENCNHICNNNCKMTKDGALCERFFGKCLTGCTPGYQGSHCVEECTKKTYGENCNLSCSSNCKIAQNGSWCDKFSGHCFGGCIPGYQGSQCVEECPRGTFGEGCEHSCSLNCNATGRLCDRKNGSCLHGCKPGFADARCLSTKESNKYKDSRIYLENIGTYVLGILGFLLVSVVILLCPCENKENSPENRDSMSKEQLPNDPIEDSLKIEDNGNEDVGEIPANEAKSETLERVQSQPSKIHQNVSYIF